jgi:hypothetical protein
MEFVDRRAATQRVAFAEDLQKVAVKQIRSFITILLGY